MKQLLNRLVFSFFILSISLLTSFLWADDLATPTVTWVPMVSSGNTSTSLKEVVVTANRVPTDAQDVSSSETILTAEDLEQKQAGTVLDALEGVPGVDVAQDGNPGETASVYIRGTNPEHTLMLYDGIPLNDPIGAPNDYEYLDNLSLDDVEQIEVLRGPQSTLWGSNAMGGVINIIPQRGPAPLGGSVLMEGGSYGTSRETVAAQGGDNSGYFDVNVSHYNTAGFPALSIKGLDATDASAEGVGAGSVNNGDDNNTASLRVGSNLSSNLQEDVLARYSQANTSLDVDNNNFVLSDDPDYFALQKQFMLDSHTDWKLLNDSWEQVLTISFADDNRQYTGIANPYSTYTEQGTFDGQMAQVNWQNNIHLVPGETLVLGIQGLAQWVSSDDTNSLDGTDNLPVTGVQAGSGFAESQTSINDHFFFNLGGRWEDNSQFGVHTTYQAGLAYFLPGLDTKFKANYGTGFLAPSLYQLYDPTYGNRTLQPETSLGYDIGFEQPMGGKNFLKVGASYFDNDLTNLIQWSDALNENTNIGQARTYGVESFVEFKGIPNLNLRGSYTYTYAWDLIDNVPLTQRPQNKASMDVDYQWGAWGWGSSLIYTGSSFDTDYSGNSVVLPSYFLINLRASYQLNSQVNLFARVDNLFNQWYENAYGYNTPGLSAYGGIKVSY